MLMYNIINVLLENTIPVISAMIACWALLRTSKIEYIQKGQRAHWFFDDYLFSVGKCIGNYEKNKEEYYANYMRYLLYADDEIKDQMKIIDVAIRKGNQDAKIQQIEKIKDMYRAKYETKQYNLKKNKCKAD